MNEYKYELNPPLARPTKEELKPFKPSSPAKRGLFSQDCHVTFTPLTYSNVGPQGRRPRSTEVQKPFRPAHVRAPPSPPS